jgi:hypothetical protein
MKAPVRITIALDKETNSLFEKLKAESKLSKSGLIRRAVRFYSENKKVIDEYGSKRINTYVDMLAHGEHIILDIDHFLLFLKLIETSPEKEKFWEDHQRVARAHAEEFAKKFHSPKEVLERLEACNFYKLRKTSEGEYTLVIDETTKKFVKTFLEEVFAGLGFKTEIKEDFAKLRVKILN